ncbi:hypothetical protein VNI00_010649 [Paramarasmius palmivorus]|uniref:Uncharacterized protein n=1 Tax=Paramarasmius palmivorus TaxID=297713 RepID=A0AAW0CIG8_9AGAR
MPKAEGRPSQKQLTAQEELPHDERGNPLPPDEAAQFFLPGGNFQVFEILCMCNEHARCFRVPKNSTSDYADHYIACCVHEKGTFGACPFFRSFNSIYNKGPGKTSFYGRIPSDDASECAEAGPSSSQAKERTTYLPTPSPSQKR